jgi:pyruvate/2-oxoglutarate dehydrogenase complex dihydrolipoamide dehydrogenase (E3) component
VERGGDIDDTCENLDSNGPTVWHAGDWTGPVSLQPDAQRSAHVAPGEIPKDIVAVPLEGVKVGLRCVFPFILLCIF